MPIFNNLPFALNDEERRRRLAEEALVTGAFPRDALTPPFNPNDPATRPSPLPPEMPGPRGRMLPGEIPGGAPSGPMPGEPPPLRPRSRMGQIDEARDVYMQGTPSGFGGRLKSAGLGALQGLAAGGLGGALVGAGTGAISPRTVRRQQFNQAVRPRIMEGFAEEDQQRALLRQGQQDALNDELKRATIGATNRSNIPRPLPPARPMNTPRGALNTETNTIIPGTEPLPREQTPRLVTFEGRTFDYNDPAQRASLEAAQTKLPRDKFGRSISRADERAGSRGGGGGRDAKARDRAVSEFNNAKQALVDATARGDLDTADELRDRLNSMVTNIASRYGDQIEVGGGEWPYIKQRGERAPSRGRAERPAKQKDPLGIR